MAESEFKECKNGDVPITNLFCEEMGMISLPLDRSLQVWRRTTFVTISLLELLGDEHGFVTISLSLKVLMTNYFVTEWFYITKKTKQLVSSVNVFNTKCFIWWQNISSTYIFILLLRHEVTIVFCHVKFSSLKDFCGDKLYCHNFFFFFFFMGWRYDFVT